MVTFTILSLFSALFSTISIILVLNIFHKVYQEDYKKPWLFIGISTLFLMSSQLLEFFHNYLNFRIQSNILTEIIIYVLNFISISFLTYGLLLEYFILRYYKGKFVKMKFIPIQENNAENPNNLSDTDIEISVSYLITDKNKTKILNLIQKYIKKGFEGFILTEENPHEIRNRLNIQKTPIAWITQLDSVKDSEYIKNSLDENSDIVDPIQLNNIITYIDNFLEQAQNPVIYLELDNLMRVNNFYILVEFLKYISNRIKKFGGIFIVYSIEGHLNEEAKNELTTFLKKNNIEELF